MPRELECKQCRKAIAEEGRFVCIDCRKDRYAADNPPPPPAPSEEESRSVSSTFRKLYEETKAQLLEARAEYDEVSDYAKRLREQVAEAEKERERLRAALNEIADARRALFLRDMPITELGRIIKVARAAIASKGEAGNE